MDQIFLVFLTVAVNSLITYFLLRRQEQRLAKKNYEDQLKFKLIHEKRVETLENLYKKFVVVNKTLKPLIEDLVRRNSSTKVKGMVWIDESDLQPFNEQAKKLSELSDYFEDNRIFLPDNIVKLVNRILSDARFPYILVITLWHFLSEVKFHFDEDKLLSLFSSLMNNTMDAYGYMISRIDLDNPDLVKMFNDIVSMMHDATRIFEDTYRSVADTRNE